MTSWITLPHIFQTGMVWQQQTRITLSGHAGPGSALTVEWTRLPLDPQSVSPHDPRYGTLFTATVACDQKGAFSVELPAFEASFDPCELMISDGTFKTCLKEILVGDIFLFVGELPWPGQEWASSSEPAHTGTVPAMQPYLRQLDILAPDADTVWTSQAHFEPSGPGQGWCLTALAQHFGRDILPDIHVPVGLLLWDAPGRRLRDFLPDTRKGLFRRLAGLKGFGVCAIVWSGHPKDSDRPDKLQEGLMKLATALRSDLKAGSGTEPAFILFHLPTYAAGQRLFYEQTLGNEALTYVRHHLAAPTALVPV
ncbi:MAG: hypothetical protein EOM08_08365, partial [Clostridia bacterium]|nr:hypothetical protein [Clostridia bacterium]